MKLTNLLKYITGCFSVLALTFIYSSCIDNNEWDVDAAYGRIFRPVTFEAGTVEATTAAIRFSKINGAESYVIELSEDSLEFKTIVGSITLSADTMTFDNSSSTPTYAFRIVRLKAETQYSARIRTTAEKRGLIDSDWATLAFMTKGENILTAISPGDITDHSVIVKWPAGSEVTEIVLTPSGGAAIRIPLTAEDISAGTKLIDGLSPATPYRVEIYNGTARRGDKSFATNESVPTDGVVYQLNGDEDIVAFLKGISDTHIILVFPEGASYAAEWTNESGAAQFTLQLQDNVRSITFWGPDNGRASLQFTSIKLGIATGKVVFRNMELQGTSNAADYVFNESTTHAISEFSFEGCDIHTFRGVLRMQNASNASVIDKVRFNNCLIHDIGGYGVVNGAQAGSGISFGDVVIENSTCYDLQDLVGAFYTPVTSSLILRNCTFYNAVGNGRYIFNFNGAAANIPPVFRIEKCIFGRYYYTTYVEANSARATNPKITEAFAFDTYKTTDFVLNTGYPLSGAEDYSKTSQDLFRDPANADFHLKDTGFGGYGIAGDPRWW